MIELTKNNKFVADQRLTSFSITYPRTVTFCTGNYSKLDVLHNLKYKIINNISKETSNHTYVRGGMTDWKHFLHDKDFSIFLTDTMNQYKHVIAPEFILGKELDVQEVWGNLLKKGDYVELHSHNTLHGILYLTEGTPLVFPELEMRFIPKPGDWIISPREILHGTEIQTSDEERINIVFNFEFRDNFRSLNEKLADIKLTT